MSTGYYPEDFSGDLGADGVSESFKSVHPMGYPISHSIHSGFSGPPTWLASVGVFLSNSLGAAVSFALCAVGVGQNPDPVSSVSGIDGTSWNNERLRGVADPFQVRKHNIEAQRDVPSNIFTEEPSGSGKFKNSANLWPEVAVIFLAFSLPGVTERLARVACGNNVGLSAFISSECFDVVMYWDALEFFG